MDSYYIQVLKRIDNINPKKKCFVINYTIPEFDMRFESTNPAITALNLLPLQGEGDFKKDHQFIDKLDKIKVIEALNMIKDLDESELNYIVLVGKNANKALKILKKKHSSLIADDKKFEVIIKPNEIHVPVKLGKMISDDSMFLSELLSLTGVTVINYDLMRATVYSQGYESGFSFMEAPGFIRFVASMGFYIDEYLFGQLFYEVGKRREDILNLFLDNLDTVFVKSLASLFDGNREKYDLTKYFKKYEDRNRIDLLVKIIENLGFDYIKNMEYDFVSVMLYEE